MMESGTGTRGRILIAEDVKALSLLMREILERAGFEVALAEDGEKCLKMAHDWSPDLLILDIQMPKLHGLAVLRRLREDAKMKDARVIVCTVRDFKGDLDAARALGVTDVIIKPFQKNDFLRRIESCFSPAPDAQAPSTDPHSAPGQAVKFLPGLKSGKGHFKLWGTRGSIPVSGPGYVRHGGNTSCMAFDLGEELIILDAGTGIRELGEELAAGSRRKIHLFITHTHWDHIQGFPFFAPCYIPGFQVTVYAAPGFGKDLPSVFRGQLDRDYFPVLLEEMRGTLEFVQLKENPVHIGAHRVFWEYTHHPGACVGYKIESGGRRVAWVSDNEFLKGYIGSPHEVRPGSDLLAPYTRLIDFVSDIDILIAEAQYPNEEYLAKVGWGHSSVSNACLLAKLARVPRWVVVHHDPRHTDTFLQQKLLITRQLLEELGHDGEVTHGFDGMGEPL